MKVLKAFIEPFEAPQKSGTLKIFKKISTNPIKSYKFHKNCFDLWLMIYSISMTKVENSMKYIWSNYQAYATIKQLWALKILDIEPNLSTYIISTDDKLRNRCFLVALCHLMVRRPNLEVVTKRILHRQVKILG